MKIKCGRREREVSTNDIITYYDNGAIDWYEISTITEMKNWNRVHPKISKQLAKDLIKQGKLVEISRTYNWGEMKCGKLLIQYKIKESEK